MPEGAAREWHRPRLPVIAYVRGKLVSKAPTRAVVDVGGVGYGMSISLTTYERLPAPDSEVQLFTRYYVHDDRHALFGFADEREREMFELLIGVSGIGPSSAQAVLSGMSAAALQEAIFYERVSELTAIKGIGRKTAERMVVELKDKIQVAGLGDAGAGPGAGVSGGPAQTEEVVLALMALGYASPLARRLAGAAVERLGADQSVEQLIKQALRER